MRPKRMEKFGCIQCQRSEESSTRGKRRVFLCRTTVRVEVKDKISPTSSLKIEGRGTFVGAIERKRGTVNRIGR